MSERMSSITLPGLSMGPGMDAYGHLPVEEMIRDYRAMAQEAADWSKQVLAASDDEFQIEHRRGVHVERDRKVVQQSSRAKPEPRSSRCEALRDDAHGTRDRCVLSDAHDGHHAWQREHAATDPKPRSSGDGHSHVVGCITPDENGQRLTTEHGYDCESRNSEGRQS